MPNGGVLRFTTDLVQTEVVLRITDSGRGIRPELLSKLFEPFETNAESMGTGLSLAIAKAVIDIRNVGNHFRCPENFGKRRRKVARAVADGLRSRGRNAERIERAR